MRLAILALGAVIVGPGGPCLAQTTNYLDTIKALYAFDSWVGRTKVPYQQTVTNWVPDFAALGMTNGLVRDEGVWTNGHKSSNYRFTPQEAPGVTVYVEVIERQDVTNAQAAMLQRFSGSQAPQPFPFGPPLGVDAGDRCYVSWGVVGITVMFVRNNIFVSIAAYDGDYSVLSLAEKLDGEVVVLSFPGPVLLQAGVAGRTFYVSVPTVVGKTYTLEGNYSPATTNWGAFATFTGDGTIQQVTFPALGPNFFRLRVQ